MGEVKNKASPNDTREMDEFLQSTDSDVVEFRKKALELIRKLKVKPSALIRRMALLAEKGWPGELEVDIVDDDGLASPRRIDDGSPARGAGHLTPQRRDILQDLRKNLANAFTKYGHHLQTSVEDVTILTTHKQGMLEAITRSKARLEDEINCCLASMDAVCAEISQLSESLVREFPDK